jgi:hypothetical protein
MTYDQWKTTNPADDYLGPEPDDDDSRDEYQKPNEDRYEREMEEKLEVMEDRLERDDDPNAECEWESRF